MTTRGRGRPCSNGEQPRAKLGQIAVVLMAYDNARATGIKRESAIAEAVRVAKARYPMLGVSRSEVGRILRDWRPRGMTEGYYFEEKIARGNPLGFKSIGVPESLDLSLMDAIQKVASAPLTRRVTCFYGPIPTPPRSNASQAPRRMSAR